ncbi:MBL fold metallo-hydrolase [Pseudalkalibacillus decolorationis]|uniref:MBL fold metallo-hydrolase n=1 Tax=Pseudalkalibacillus decolorationis TaxID=163879 RepID=UPI002148424A|nr:MBL fold metallo-hydrolase [Pseudalkalibacillus decolorationis]
MNREVEHAFLPVTSVSSGKGNLVIRDVYCYTNQIVNICFINTSNNKWVLIDAGMPKSAEKIIKGAEKQFGQGCRPEAIILTHGHFDHVGSVEVLAEHWDIPVYAHQLEFPYLTGNEDYPPGDPTVDGGIISEMSPLFPNHSIDIKNRLRGLPGDGSIPFLTEWRWIHTPGHTPGHISLYRDKDSALIVGDAFVTVDQESLYKVMTQQQEIHGPPAYFTMDWDAAKESVRTLKGLEPEIAITGHGVPMSGEELKRDLSNLAENFDTIARPKSKSK